MSQPTTPPHEPRNTLFKTLTDVTRPDTQANRLQNFKDSYSKFLEAGGALSAEAMIFSTICNGRTPYERMSDEGHIDRLKHLIIDYGLTFMSPQVQLQGKDDLKQKLLDFVALLDIIDIGHDAMIKLDCILSTYLILGKDTQTLTNVLGKIFTKEGNFKPAIGKEEIIAIINQMYKELKDNRISTFEPPPSILVLKETIDDVLPKLQVEYNRGNMFIGFQESGRPIPGVPHQEGSVYSSLDGGSSRGGDPPNIKRYCSEYGIVHIYARFIRQGLYEIIQIVESKGYYHCFVILSTNEISLNKVLLAIATYLNKNYEDSERGAGFSGLTPTMKLIRYENRESTGSLDDYAEQIHRGLESLYTGGYGNISQLELTQQQIKVLNNILECCLWALKSMGDKGGTIGFFLKQEQKCIMWTVDSFLAAIIPGYYYAGLIDEHPIVALSNAKGWDFFIPPSSDSTGYATSLYQLQTYDPQTYTAIDFLKINYGFDHLLYVTHILFPSIRKTHTSFFYIILEALLNNILRYIETKFLDYDEAMSNLIQYRSSFEGMTPQDKQAFLLRVPNELTLDFSSIIGKLLLLFFEFSEENQFETAQKIFNQIASKQGLNRFDKILGTKRTMNDLIGNKLDVLLNAFRFTPTTGSFLDFIDPTLVMDIHTDRQVQDRVMLLKEHMGDKTFNDANIHDVYALLERREKLYEENFEHLQKACEKSSHFQEEIHGKTTFGHMPRTLEVRIKTEDDTTFIYLRTNMTQALVQEYATYLHEMTTFDEEYSNFSIEQIESIFYIKFPINVQFLADLLQNEPPTKELSVYRSNIRGEWGIRQLLNVHHFCKKEIRNILEQLFPREVLMGDINVLLPQAATTLERVASNTLKRMKAFISPRPSQETQRLQQIQTEISELRTKIVSQKQNSQNYKRLMDQLKKLEEEQQQLLANPKAISKTKNPRRGGRKTRRIHKKHTLKHKKRSMRKTQCRRKIIK